MVSVRVGVLAIGNTAALKTFICILYTITGLSTSFVNLFITLFRLYLSYWVMVEPVYQASEQHFLSPQTDYGCDIEKGSVCTYHPGSVHCVRAIQAR